LKETLSPGARFGRALYILRRSLARSETASVWLAWDVKAEREVVLKVLIGGVGRDANAIERLKEVVERNKTLIYPHIVRTFDFVQDFDFPAISMEHIEGWSLASLRVDQPNHRYGLDKVTTWVRQLCSALNYAHREAGVVHGNLRTSSILLNQQEDLKLIGFDGLRNAGSRSPAAELELGFMSPQVALGEKPAISDDVYGVGAIIFDLLTGTPPFYKGQVLSQICERPPGSMTNRLAELKINDTIPAVVEDTVALCLAKDPAQRPASIAKVLELLERSEVPPQIVTTPPIAPQPAPAVTEQPAEPQITEEPPGEASVEPAPEQPFLAPKPKKLPVAIYALAAAAVLLIGVGILALLLGVRKHRVQANSASNAASVDKSFLTPTNVDHEISVVLSQPDGKIIAAGMFTQFGENARHGIARLNPDGTFDAAFLAEAMGNVYALALQPDGKLFIGGTFTKVNGATRRRLARLNADGALDDGFSGNMGANRDIHALQLQPDGKLIVAGNFDASGGKKLNRIVRMNPEGTRDAAFNPGAGASAIIWSVAVQPDGKILAVGDFAAFDRKARARIVRLEAGGAVDDTFDEEAGANAQIFAVALQRDWKILIGGDFFQVNKTEQNRIARLNADGSVDPTFRGGAGANSGIRCLAVQPDGKILVGGIFTSIQGIPRNRIARLNSDGTVDQSFNPGAGATEVVRCIALQSDGAILLAGNFKSYDGVACGKIIRLHGDRRPTY
jgi:uncharacterized delta-60 repeat protein